MREFVKRPLAKEDLIGIWSYTFNKWGEAQADKYLSEIDAKIAQLQHIHTWADRGTKCGPAIAHCR